MGAITKGGIKETAETGKQRKVKLGVEAYNVDGSRARYLKKDCTRTQCKWKPVISLSYLWQSHYTKNIHVYKAFSVFFSKMTPKSHCN